MGRVRWSQTADADFDHYSAWIWQEATTGDAMAWLAELIGWIEQLGEFPRLGTPRDDLADGARSRAFRKSVVIVYTVGRADDVTVLRLFSRGRDITTADFAAPE